jgi:hypothetical protein
MRAIVLLMMLVGLTGCVTSDAAPTVVPVARGQASVTITRPNAYYASAVPVDLDANGVRIVSLASGGSYTGPIPPGPVTLTATSWSSPGRYTVRFNAEPGRQYAFEVAPRNEQMAATFVFGVVGLAADSVAHEETSGAFKITAIAK